MTQPQPLSACGDLTEIAVHPDPDAANSLAVMAWCITCNARKAGSARIAREAFGLDELVRAAREHFASDQHRNITPSN